MLLATEALGAGSDNVALWFIAHIHNGASMTCDKGPSEMPWKTSQGTASDQVARDLTCLSTMSDNIA